MENPLLAHAPLPAFAYIRPEHVEPAVREVLAAGRARIDELAAVGEPDLRAPSSSRSKSCITACPGYGRRSAI